MFGQIRSYLGGSPMKSARTLPLILAAFFILLAGARSAYAQGFGTIVGTVTDPTGSVVSGAKVTITDQGTQLSRVVTSNEQGYYVAPALHPSTYTVNATAQGFASFVQKDITLLTDQSLTLDVRSEEPRLNSRHLARSRMPSSA